MIPYLITVSCPDYKRPRVSLIYSQLMNDTDLESRLLQLLVEEVIEKNGDIDYKTFADLIENYYRDSYMDNIPFSCSYVKDEQWHDLDYDESEFMRIYRTLSCEEEIAYDPEEFMRNYRSSFYNKYTETPNAKTPDAETPDAP